MPPGRTAGLALGPHGLSELVNRSTDPRAWRRGLVGLTLSTEVLAPPGQWASVSILVAIPGLFFHVHPGPRYSMRAWIVPGACAVSLACRASTEENTAFKKGRIVTSTRHWLARVDEGKFADSWTTAAEFFRVPSRKSDG